MLNKENLYLFQFAWKSMRRNWGRSFLIGLAVSLAVVITIWIVAFFEGLNKQIEDAVVKTNTGMFQVQESSFAIKTESKNPLPFEEAQRKLWSAAPVTSFSPELVFDGYLSTPEGTAKLSVVGVEPDYHKNVIPISEKLVSGSYLKSSDEGEVVIGKELAQLFILNVGDDLIVNYQDKLGKLRSEILTIKGIFNYNSKAFQKRYVYISQRTWQKIFLKQEMDKTLFNRIVIMAPLSTLPELQHRAKDQGVVLKTWKNINPEMGVVMDFHKGMVRFFFIIIALTITMTILTPVRMLWQERVKELKMMSVIGVANKMFWKICLFEVFQMVFLSSLFSIVCSALIIGASALSGINISFLNDGKAIERAGIKMPQIIYPELSVTDIGMIFVFVMLILSISYFWSIHSTLKMLKESR